MSPRKIVLRRRHFVIDILISTAHVYEVLSAGVEVLRISTASVQAHAKFTAKYGLGFLLLSDTSKNVATAYGAWGKRRCADARCWAWAHDLSAG
jgi:alkyl hydroperoxide reductase subunit AhpC